MFNRYETLAAAVANGYVRSSTYVTMDDGCRIAVDVLRPARDGQVLSGRCPSILRATGYRRSFRKGEQSFNIAAANAQLAHLPVGALVTSYESRPILRRLIHHGYNIVAMDLRGTGASFGQNRVRIWRDGADAARVVEWIAAQPWSTDRVGMIGGSWEGVVQIAAAVYAPTALRCVLPSVVPSAANAIVDNGLYLEGFCRDWTAMRKGQDRLERALPVDDPQGPALLDAAFEERGKSVYLWDGDAYTGDAEPLVEDFSQFTREVSEHFFRLDAPAPPAPELGPLRDVLEETQRYNRSGCATYIMGGWWDMTLTAGYLQFFNALTVAKKLLIGPWNHNTVTADDETHRWFDHWLKETPTGIMDDPPIHFAISNAVGPVAWYGSQQWPPAAVTSRSFFLSARRSATLASSNDGSLDEEPPHEDAYHERTVDTSVSLGEHSRTRFMFRGLFIRSPDLRARGERCLTYTSAPLPKAMDILGAPDLRLRMETDNPLGAIIVTLEEVIRDERVVYITEGALSIAHRQVAARLNEPMEFGLELYPVAWRIQAGSRLRITVAGSDKGNRRIFHGSCPWRQRLQLLADGACRLSLPLANAERPVADGELLDDPYRDQELLFAFENSPPASDQ